MKSNMDNVGQTYTAKSGIIYFIFFNVMKNVRGMNNIIICTKMCISNVLKT